jgi:NitT/TauT family transport system permease protein
MIVRLCSALLLLALLAGWELYCRASGVSSLIVPAPSAVLATLWSEIVSGRLLPHLRITATEMTLGLALGCAIGLLTGILLSEAAFLRQLLHPYIVASQVVPKLALGPLFIIWFGFGMTSTIVITALICFFPLMENTVTGLRQVDPARRELFRMLGASRLQTLLRLKLPSALPMIMAGLRVAVVLALVGAVVGEFIGGRAGLGASIIAAQSVMDSSLMFALFIVITLLGMLFYQAALQVERLMLRHHLKG